MGVRRFGIAVDEPDADVSWRTRPMMGVTCLSCGSPSNNLPLCSMCARDPFKVELARKQAAKLGDGDTLEKLYSPEYAFLEQGNVAAVWNDLLAHGKDSILDFTVWRNKVSVGLVPRGAHRILEIGIGMGHALVNLSKSFPGAEIYGTDVSSDAVARASTRFKGNFAVAETGHLPWPGVKFDSILLLEVLEHIEAPLTFTVLRWIHSLLTESGRLIISVPLERVDDLRRSYFLCPHCGRPVQQNGHVRSYSELQPIQLELARAGFTIERKKGLAGGSYFGVRRQWLMSLFPNRISPMVMIFRCYKQS